MPNRWGLGPVFVYESILGARRWQVYALRSLFVAVLLAGMTTVWASKDTPGFLGPGPTRGRSPTFQQMAKVGEGFFYALAGIQLSLVMLAAPAAAAGAVCTDRLRGTLLHMMLTDLSDIEIVLGKLASRLAPVFGLIIGAVPVTALAALLGGIDFEALVGLFAVSITLAVLGCALAMAVSVRATKIHEVLMAVYVLEGLSLLSLPIWWGLSHGGTGIIAPPDWFQKANPYVLVFAPYTKPGFVEAFDFQVFAAAALGFALALVGLTIARLRRAVIDEASRGDQARRRRGWLTWEKVFPSWRGPSLDGNPILWREWHRNRPSRLARWLWGGLFAATWGLAVWGTYDIGKNGVNNGPEPLMFGFLLQVAFGFLMLSATAPTSLSEERARGSLDVLMSTPIATRAIVAGKWWGAYRWVLLLAVLPIYTGLFIAVAVPEIPSYAVGWRPPTPRAVPLTTMDRVQGALYGAGDYLASGAVIVSLGLALATWIRRQGRAVAFSVIAYFFFAIGWIFVIEFFLEWVLNSLNLYRAGIENRWIITSLLSISPIGGPINAIEQLQHVSQSPRGPLWIGCAVVILVKLWVAALLYALVVRTFDRCLGRVSDRRSPGMAQPRRPKRVPAEA